MEHLPKLVAMETVDRIGNRANGGQKRLALDVTGQFGEYYLNTELMGSTMYTDTVTLYTLKDLLHQK
ncbi:Hypothetical protein BN69_3185 [Methylocystis sp. SC2]|nr:Hypothetical protein BN69_3185 [Methylocystis sp. SC2]